MPGKPSMNRPACRATTKAGKPCARRAAAGSAYCGVHGGATRPIGAPPKLDTDLVARITIAVERGVTWEVAAQVAGVHPRTLLEWRDRGADDDEAGRDTVYAHLHREVICARAAGETSLVGLIRRHGVTDWRAAAWLLERSRPERWARRDKLDVDVTERAKPRTVTPEEPARRDAIVELLASATRPPAGHDQ